MKVKEGRGLIFGRIRYWYCNFSHSLTVYKGYLLGSNSHIRTQSNISSLKEYHQHDIMVYFHTLRGVHPERVIKKANPGIKCTHISVKQI